MMLLSMNRGTLSFVLFRIPIEIQPLSWLLLAFLGGAFTISGASDLYPVLIFVVAGMISIIAHELGHALAGRELMGSSPSIVIHSFGGTTTNSNMRHMTRARYFAMVLAGPIGGFLPALLAFILLCLQVGDVAACLRFVWVTTLPFGVSDGDVLSLSPVIEALSGMGMGMGRLNLIMELYTSFFFVGIWWTILNLLPIFPLDGGKLLATLLDNYLIAAVVGIVFSVLLLLFALHLQSVYTTLFACYFIYLNWQHFQLFRQSRQSR